MSSNTCQDIIEKDLSGIPIEPNYIDGDIDINITNVQLPKCNENSSLHYIIYHQGGANQTFLTGFFGEDVVLVDPNSLDPTKFLTDFCLDRYYKLSTDVSHSEHTNTYYLKYELSELHRLVGFQPL